MNKILIVGGLLLLASTATGSAQTSTAVSSYGADAQALSRGSGPSLERPDIARAEMMSGGSLGGTGALTWNAQREALPRSDHSGGPPGHPYGAE